MYGSRGCCPVPSDRCERLCTSSSLSPHPAGALLPPLPAAPQDAAFGFYHQVLGVPVLEHHGNRSFVHRLSCPAPPHPVGTRTLTLGVLYPPCLFLPCSPSCPSLGGVPAWGAVSVPLMDIWDGWSLGCPGQSCHTYSRTGLCAGCGRVSWVCPGSGTAASWGNMCVTCEKVPSIFQSGPGVSH